MNYPPDVELMIGMDQSKALLVSGKVYSFDELGRVVRGISYGEKPGRALKTSWDMARKNPGDRLSYIPAAIAGEELLVFPLVVKGRETDQELVFVRTPEPIAAETPRWVLSGLRARTIVPKTSRGQNSKEQSVGDLVPLTDKQAYDLACLAAPEDWKVLDKLWSSWSERRLLKSYIEYTFKRLCIEWKVRVEGDKDDRILAFNTGLQDAMGLRDIIAVYIPDEAPYWKAKGFYTVGDGSELDCSVTSRLGGMPKPAEYFNAISDVLIDLNQYDGTLNEKHIFEERLCRFPVEFLERVLSSSDACLEIIERAKQNDIVNNDDFREGVLGELQGIIDDDQLSAIKDHFRKALDRGLRKALRNYTLVVPCFFFRWKHMAHMLPICLTESTKPDLALILDAEDGKIVGKTVYSMRYAYQSARLIMKPAESWVYAAGDRFRRGLGSEGMDHFINKTDPMVQSFEFARLSGLGVMHEIRDGNTIGVYRDDDKPKPDILLPGPNSQFESEYHFVSQVHGRFQFENGRWYFVDENSTNGTVHIDRDGNPVRLMRGQRVELAHDTELIFANSPSLRFMCMS